MPSIDSELKSARMSAETWRIVSGEMEKYGLTFSGWVKKSARERLTVENKRYSEDEELEMMAAYMGISAEEFLKLVVKAVEDGKLYYEKGELIVRNGSTT